MKAERPPRATQIDGQEAGNGRGTRRTSSRRPGRERGPMCGQRERPRGRREARTMAARWCPSVTPSCVDPVFAWSALPIAGNAIGRRLHAGSIRRPQRRRAAEISRAPQRRGGSPQENNYILMSHEKYQHCIDACQACVVACEHCATACLHEDDVKMMARCIELDRSCADICSLAVREMARDSRLAERVCQLCAEICEECGDECAKHKKDHCQECAEVCHRCAEACREMAGAGSSRR